MGFWRNVGYFISVLIVIGGFILFPIGLIGAAIGFVFIWMLKKSARDERMEKHLKKIAGINVTEQERIEFREWQEKKKKNG